MNIAVASGKGGTGKTFVTTNLYRTFKNNKKEVVLIDCDAEVPNASLFFNTQLKKQRDVRDFRPEFDIEACAFCGRCVDFCSYNALLCIPTAKVIKLLPELCHGCTACLHACKRGAIKPSSIVIGEVTEYTTDVGDELYEARLKVTQATGVPILKETIVQAQAETCSEFYLMDAPPGTSCPFIQTVNKADFVILVTEPTPFGLSDLKQAIDTLKSLQKPYGVIVNRCDVGNQDVFDFLNESAVQILASIPFSKQVASCYASGKIAVDEIPEIGRYFKQVMQKLINL